MREIDDYDLFGHVVERGAPLMAGMTVRCEIRISIAKPGQ